MKRPVLLFLSRYHLLLATGVLLGAAAFFCTQVHQFRSAIRSDNPSAFRSDDIVTIVKVVDGEDLLIENLDGVKTRIRLIGIKSFDSTVSDPMISEYGRICYNYLNATVLDKQARLRIAPKKLGNRGRLLGQLFVQAPADGPGEHTMDLGLRLITQGYTMVYTEFAFDPVLELAYLTAQAQTRENKAGFWSNPTVANQADAFRKIWEKKKAEGKP